jgi:hypothetical protein
MLKIREILLALPETTYGVDPGLSAATDAILVDNLAWALEGAKMYERKPVRASMAPLKPIFGGTLLGTTFDTEIKGSGSAGVAPEIGPLFRGCRFGETIVGGTSVAYSPVSGTDASLSLYYFQDGTLWKRTGCRGNPAFNLETSQSGKISWGFTGHSKMRGTAQAGAATTITLPTTYSTINETYTGQTLKINSGTGAGQSRAITAYVGATRVATVAAWTVVPDATSVFEIDNGPYDFALPTPTYDSAVPVPLIAVPFSVDSYAAVIAKLAFDMGGALAMPADISSPDGVGQIQLTARKLTGSFDPEAVLIATQDFIGKWKGGNAMALDTGVIGALAGNRWRVQMPGITYTNVGKGDRDGISTYEMSFMAAETTTDNEVTVTFT